MADIVATVAIGSLRSHLRDLFFAKKLYKPTVDSSMPVKNGKLRVLARLDAPDLRVTTGDGGVLALEIAIPFSDLLVAADGDVAKKLMPKAGLTQDVLFLVGMAGSIAVRFTPVFLDASVPDVGIPLLRRSLGLKLHYGLGALVRLGPASRTAATAKYDPAWAFKFSAKDIPEALKLPDEYGAFAPDQECPPFASAVEHLLSAVLTASAEIPGGPISVLASTLPFSWDVFDVAANDAPLTALLSLGEAGGSTLPEVLAGLDAEPGGTLRRFFDAFTDVSVELGQASSDLQDDYVSIRFETVRTAFLQGMGKMAQIDPGEPPPPAFALSEDVAQPVESLAVHLSPRFIITTLLTRLLERLHLADPHPFVSVVETLVSSTAFSGIYSGALGMPTFKLVGPFDVGKVTVTDCEVGWANAFEVIASDFSVDNGLMFNLGFKGPGLEIGIYMVAYHADVAGGRAFVGVAPGSAKWGALEDFWYVTGDVIEGYIPLIDEIMLGLLGQAAIGVSENSPLATPVLLPTVKSISGKPIDYLRFVSQLASAVDTPPEFDVGTIDMTVVFGGSEVFFIDGDNDPSSGGVATSKITLLNAEQKAVLSTDYDLAVDLKKGVVHILGGMLPAVSALSFEATGRAVGSDILLTSGNEPSINIADELETSSTSLTMDGHLRKWHRALCFLTRSGNIARLGLTFDDGLGDVVVGEPSGVAQPASQKLRIRVRTTKPVGALYNGFVPLKDVTTLLTNNAVKGVWREDKTSAPPLANWRRYHAVLELIHSCDLGGGPESRLHFFRDVGWEAGEFVGGELKCVTLTPGKLAKTGTESEPSQVELASGKHLTYQFIYTFGTEQSKIRLDTAWGQSFDPLYIRAYARMATNDVGTVEPWYETHRMYSIVGTLNFQLAKRIPDDVPRLPKPRHSPFESDRSKRRRRVP